MRLVVLDKNNQLRLNRLLEWLIYMVCYAVVFLAVCVFFKSCYIDMSYYGVYGLLAVMIISILNNTIKPVLVSLTMPLTGITFGLFYPCINLFILKLTDWILQGHFDLRNIWIALLISVLLSVCNAIMERIVIKPLIQGVKKHE